MASATWNQPADGKSWKSGKAFSLKIVPVPYRTVDEGHHTRFQMYESEHQQGKHGPKRMEVLEK